MKNAHNVLQYGIHIESDYSSVVYPCAGTFNVVYNGEEYAVEYTEEGSPKSCSGEILYYTRLTVSHDDLSKLQEFVTTAIKCDIVTESKNQIKLFTSKSNGYFSHCGYIYTQSIAHIYLPDDIKDGIKRHIDQFLNSKKRYQTYGRLYKTAFLLTGPPGSGKTSFVKAVALEYNRPVYILNFTKALTDESFIELMTELKEDSVLLIEDIDAFFVDRQPVNINISFSAFINFLDGTLGKGNGVITFITANNPDRLDHALIRPGRIDKIVKFDKPKKKEIEACFYDMTLDANGEKFAKFYEQIAPLNTSMSGIVDYLFRNPEEYMECIDDLKKQTSYINDIVSEKTEKMFN
jgi:hypothetical protein